MSKQELEQVARGLVAGGRARGQADRHRPGDVREGRRAADVREQAAQIAHDKGIVIHTVAVGDPEAAGEDKLDEDVLKGVSGATGGGYYRALDRQKLAEIYTKLDAVETRKVDTVSFQPKVELYWLPLAGLAILTMLFQALRLVRLPHARHAEATP